MKIRLRPPWPSPCSTVSRFSLVVPVHCIVSLLTRRFTRYREQCLKHLLRLSHHGKNSQHQKVNLITSTLSQKKRAGRNQPRWVVVQPLLHPQLVPQDLAVHHWQSQHRLQIRSVLLVQWVPTSSAFMCLSLGPTMTSMLTSLHSGRSFLPRSIRTPSQNNRRVSVLCPMRRQQRQLLLSRV